MSVGSNGLPAGRRGPGRHRGGRLVLWLALVMLGWSSVAHASVNFEKRRRALVRPGWSFGLDVRGGLRRGPVNVLELGGGMHVGWQERRLGLLALSEHAVRAQSLARAGQDLIDAPKQRIVNRHMGHLRMFARLTDRVSAELFTQIEADELILLRWRHLVGTGLRISIVDRPGLQLFYGGGYVPELEVLDRRWFVDQPSGRGTVNAWHRVGQVVDVAVGKGPAKLVSTTYLIPRIDDPADFRFLEEAAVVVSLSDRLSLRLAAAVRFDSRPPRYCAVRSSGGSCPAESLRRVVSTEIAVDPALAITF